MKTLLRNEVNDGRLVRPDPRALELLQPLHLIIDTKREVSPEPGTIVFGPCGLCKHYGHVAYLNPLDGGICTAALASRHFMHAKDTCTGYQPTEEATRYAKAQG